MPRHAGGSIVEPVARFSRCGRVGTRNESAHAAFDLPPGQEDTPSAFQALQADIGAQSHDGPVMTAAGMRLLQPQNIPDREWNWLRVPHLIAPDLRIIQQRAYRRIPRLVTSVRES